MSQNFLIVMGVLIGRLLFLLSLLPCPLYIGVTWAGFQTDGKVPVSMQWFISRLRGKEIEGAAIFSNLALRPSDPAALRDGSSFSNSPQPKFTIPQITPTLSVSVMCGIVNCGLFTLSTVRSLMCLRGARDNECDGRFRRSSRG